MKNPIIFLLISILIGSCSKDSFKNDIRNCIDNIKIPNNSFSAELTNYLRGEMNGNSLSIYNGDGEYTFVISQFRKGTVLPGEWFNPLDTSWINQIGLSLMFTNSDHSSRFYLLSPGYEKKASLKEMVEDIGQNKFLVIGDDFANFPEGYVFTWIYKCQKENDYDLSISTGVDFLGNYYYDQYGKKIEVLKFEKTMITESIWLYEIELDIDVNLFTNRGYFGEFKGIFNAVVLVPD